MNNSPKIFNKKEFDKRKEEVYKMLKTEVMVDRDEKRLKLQAKREVAILHEEFKKRDNIKNEPLYDPKMLFDELNEFIKKKNNR